MIRYIKVDSNTWVKADLDNGSAQILIKSDLETQKTFMETQLANIPPAPSDEILLEWAKQNYPSLGDGEKSRVLIEEQLVIINSDLEQMK